MLKHQLTNYLYTEEFSWICLGAEACLFEKKMMDILSHVFTEFTYEWIVEDKELQLCLFFKIYIYFMSF